jgi:hypothetical protein
VRPQRLVDWLDKWAEDLLLLSLPMSLLGVLGVERLRQGTVQTPLGWTFAVAAIVAVLLCWGGSIAGFALGSSRD